MQNKGEHRERIGIRTAYRNLLHDTNQNKEEFLSPGETGRNKLQETLDQANEIFSQVKMPREAAMDSQLMAVLAGFGVQHAQALRTEFVVFQPTEFTQKLMAHLQVPRLQELARPSIPEEGWVALGRMADPYFNKAPVLNYMFGAFERGPPKKKPRPERRRIEKEVIAKNAVIPKQVTNIKEGERKEATTEEVERIFLNLRLFYNKWGKHPICYFEFVVNPTSFGQTIENIFYTSFLVRDGHVRIFLDDDRLPVIEPIKVPEEGEAPLADENKQCQVVISMTKTEWKEIITIFNINEPLIPTRKPIHR